MLLLCSVSRDSLHRLRFWINICELFFLLVCIGTCIGKFFKHSRDVVIQGFHIRVMFVSHGFDFIVNVVKGHILIGEVRYESY